MNITIKLNKYKSANAVANFDLDFNNGLTLKFVELVNGKEGNEFLTHQSNKKVDDSYKTTNHSFMTKEFQATIIPVIKEQLKRLEQPVNPAENKSTNVGF